MELAYVAASCTNYGMFGERFPPGVLRRTAAVTGQRLGDGESIPVYVLCGEPIRNTVDLEERTGHPDNPSLIPVGSLHRIHFREGTLAIELRIVVSSVHAKAALLSLEDNRQPWLSGWGETSRFQLGWRGVWDRFLDWVGWGRSSDFVYVKNIYVDRVVIETSREESNGA